MKQGRALPEVLTELKRQNEAKQDYIAPAEAFHLDEDGTTFSITHLNTGQEEVFGTTDLFHRQVGSALNIPAKYYDLMRSSKPELLAQNVNTWFADKENSYMIRSMDYGSMDYGSMDYGSGRVARAFLSDRYRRIDNLEIANAVLPIFAGVPGMQVMSCEVTESKLYLKIVDTRKEYACVGDTVQSGVVISNSEVGLGAVVAQPLLYTLQCTNGMVVNSMAKRKTHVGRTAKALEDSFTIYSDETIEAEDKAFLLRLRDTVTAIFDEVRVKNLISTLESSADAKITVSVQDVVELTGKTYELNQPEQDNILNYLIDGGDLSLYGLSNDITRASKDVDSYDRATALEGIGWQVATMESKQWREMNT